MKQQQRGVVLLSCLIFLLLVMMLVRFTLSASKFEQEKVAADIDDTTSYEYANLVLHDVEYQIRGQNAQGVYCGSAKGTCPNFPIPIDTELTDERKQYKVALNTLVTMAKNPKRYPGIFTQAAQTACKAPLWQCVNWNKKYYHGAHKAKYRFQPASFGYYTRGAVSNTPGVPTPQYIIEVLDGKIFGRPGGTMVRVTTMGYGREGDNARVSNTMLQATYFIDQPLGGGSGGSGTGGGSGSGGGSSPGTNRPARGNS